MKFLSNTSLVKQILKKHVYSMITFFSKFYKTYTVPEMQTFWNGNLGSLVLYEDEVFNVLINLNANKAFGLEGLPAIFF